MFISDYICFIYISNVSYFPFSCLSPVAPLSFYVSLLPLLQKGLALLPTFLILSLFMFLCFPKTIRLLIIFFFFFIFDFILRCFPDVFNKLNTHINLSPLGAHNKPSFTSYFQCFTFSLVMFTSSLYCLLSVSDSI